MQEANELLSADQLDEALAAYKDAERMEPDLADALLRRGPDPLPAVKRNAEAEPALVRAVELNPEEAIVLTSTSGRSWEGSSDWKKPRALSARPPSSSPSTRMGWRGLGLTLYNQGRGAEARVALEKYLPRVLPGPAPIAPPSPSWCMRAARGPTERIAPPRLPG